MTKLMIVGEAWGKDEAAQGKPFVGASGRLLRAILANAGIAKQDCYFTNVFNQHPPKNDISYFYQKTTLIEAKIDADPIIQKEEKIPGMPAIQKGKYISAKYEFELQRLWEEIDREQPNCILALGNTALWALCKETAITKFRGTLLYSHQKQKKVLPTLHPAAILRNYKDLPIFAADINKAAIEMQKPELTRPQRFIWIEPEIKDLHNFWDTHMKNAENISVDIETSHNTITEIGFAPSETFALVVPFLRRRPKVGNYWQTFEEELQAWKWVKMVLEEKPVIGQNFNYDLQFLWMQYGIPVRTVADDTMILHHTLYMEMQKGLGFLGSIYTNEPTWKAMRKTAAAKVKN